MSLFFFIYHVGFLENKELRHREFYLIVSFNFGIPNQPTKYFRSVYKFNNHWHEEMWIHHLTKIVQDKKWIIKPVQSHRNGVSIGFKSGAPRFLCANCKRSLRCMQISTPWTSRKVCWGVLRWHFILILIRPASVRPKIIDTCLTFTDLFIWAVIYILLRKWTNLFSFSVIWNVYIY